MTFDPRSLLARLPIERFRNPPPLVAVVRLSGVISASPAPLRGGALNVEIMAAPLERAFRINGVKAVALVVNSPGGSPVQSALLAERIRRLAEEKKVPVFAFAEDVAASGGYWLALAADEIWADASSLLGSVGVISASFGFQGLMARIGVERRLFRQGENKSLLDPFLPVEPQELLRLERLQKEIHERFIGHVRARRAGKLVDPEANGVFSGEVFTGARALELGLIDGLGDLRSVMRTRFGEKVRFKHVGADSRGWLRRRIGLRAAEPGDWAAALLSAAEERAAWSRFGL